MGRWKPVRTVRDSALYRAHLTPLGRWAAGPLGRWAAGPLGRWAAGPLGRWAAGPLALYPTPCRDRMSSAISSAGPGAPRPEGGASETVPDTRSAAADDNPSDTPGMACLSRQSTGRRTDPFPTRVPGPVFRRQTQLEPFARNPWLRRNDLFSDRSVSALHPDNHEFIVSYREYFVSISGAQLFPLTWPMDVLGGLVALWSRVA